MRRCLELFRDGLPTLAGIRRPVADFVLAHLRDTLGLPMATWPTA